MTSSSVLMKKERVIANHLTPEKAANKTQGSAVQQDYKEKTKKAIEANNLRYNYETGFHYME